MLENLEKVNWGELRHAYGAATDVPDLIRKIAHAPPILGYTDLENSAFNQLMIRVFHQGDIYTCTIQVIPFLLELLTYDAVQNKAQILNVLHSMLNVLSERDLDLESYTSEELNENFLVQKEFLEAIEKGKDTYSKLSFNDDSRIRESAKELLSVL